MLEFMTKSNRLELSRLFPLMLLFLALAQFLSWSRPADARIEMIAPVPLQKQDVDALRRVERSPFQTLKSRFEVGREPTDSDFKSWRTGRCYFTDRPLQPVPTLLTADTLSDNGPAFSDASNRKIIPFVSRTDKPGLFDRLSSRALKEVRACQSKHRDDVAFPVRSNASVVSAVPRSMSLQARNYEFRKSDHHLIMKVVCMDHGGCWNENQTWFLYYEDDTVAYCYYFADAKQP
jgi:hypothetical protein